MAGGTHLLGRIGLWVPSLKVERLERVAEDSCDH